MKTALEESFEQMGARVRIITLFPPERPGRMWNGKRLSISTFRSDEPLRIDIGRDEQGEYFDIQRRQDVRVRVADVTPHDRHLLLTYHRGTGWSGEFLCGHDERAWFVAAIPEEAKARTVQEAKDALKPKEVWEAIEEFNVPMEERDERHTAAFIRQGEWFFIPRPEMEIDWSEVVYNEPIQRGAGKPHFCEAMYRTQGVRVYVSPLYPNGLTADEFKELPLEERRWREWEERVRDAKVFVRGRVKHRDHATIALPFWHEVVMNTETKSESMRHVAFLD